jgi:hypothetical protein
MLNLDATLAKKSKNVFGLSQLCGDMQRCLTTWVFDVHIELAASEERVKAIGLIVPCRCMPDSRAIVGNSIHEHVIAA